jgi:hypothetical protein
VLRARDGERAGCPPDRDGVRGGVARAGEDRAGIDRIIDVPEATAADVAITVRPRSGPALTACSTSRVRARRIRASADSRWWRIRPRARSPPWTATRHRVAGRPDPARPTLTLSLPSEQLVSGCGCRPRSPWPPAPFDVTVDTGTSRTRVFVPLSGVVGSSARTSTLQLTFGAVSPVRSTDSRTGAVDLPRWESRRSRCSAARTSGWAVPAAPHAGLRVGPSLLSTA